MDTIEQITQPQPRPKNHRSGTPIGPHSGSGPSTFAETLDEILPLHLAVPVAGPPAILILGPWLALGLILAGPFLLLVTFILAGVIVVALTGAILVPPYLLLRLVRQPRARPFARRSRGHQHHERHPFGAGLRAQRAGAQVFSGPADQPAAVAQLNSDPRVHLPSDGL
ncbi:MAG TPA: hypothetical protein VFW09_11325 [Solirubrobacteraceae bacterium]|nr:hypothetical protein [Solirubrobacteraceae bacterium]